MNQVYRSYQSRIILLYFYMNNVSNTEMTIKCESDSFVLSHNWVGLFLVRNLHEWDSVYRLDTKLVIWMVLCQLKDR